MSGAIEVRGAAQLRRTLKRAGIDVQDLKDAHARAAKLVEQAATPHTPRDTGALAASMRSAGTARAAIVRAGNARLPYGPVIHYGWPDHHIAAQPWITDAAIATEAAWGNTYMHALETIINAIEGAPGP